MLALQTLGFAPHILTCWYVPVISSYADQKFKAILSYATLSQKKKIVNGTRNSTLGMRGIGAFGSGRQRVQKRV